MKIAYFGCDLFFECFEFLISKNHNIGAVFTGERNTKDRPFAKNIRRLSEKLNIPIKTKAEKEDLANLDCDIIISGGYFYKIPTPKNCSAKYAINIHPSLLPIGAGPDPILHIILKGLEKSGVTLHKLEEEIDSGDIVLQKSFKLTGNENYEEVAQKNKILAVSLLDKFLKKPEFYWKKSYQQENRYKEYWPALEPKEYVVNYNESLDEIQKRLRAHRFLTPEGKMEYVENIKIINKLSNRKAGEVILKSGSNYIVATKTGVISFTINVKDL